MRELQYKTASLLVSALGAWLLVPLAAAASAEANRASLADIDAAYRRAFDSELYDEAVDAQKRYISTLLRQPGHDRADWGDALDRLGEAQLLAEDYDSAVENFELAIDVLEDETNRLDDALISPLVGLARARVGAGDLPGAIDTYQRAIHLQQVNFGPHAFEQAEVLDEMSDISYELGDLDAANGYKQAYASVYRQNYEDDYLMQVDALLSQARLLATTGRLLDAQYAYRRIIADLEDADGRRSLALLPAIYQFADLLQNNKMADGINGAYVARRYLRRAVHIAEKNENATPVDRANAYIAFADYLSVHSADGVSAMRFYQQAWDELSVGSEYAAEREVRFAKPVLLNPVPYNTAPVMQKVLRLAAQDDGTENLTRLSARFDIDEKGGVHNIAIVEGDPTGYMDPILARHVELFVFRPGFVDSKPAEFSDQLYVIEYAVPEMDPDLRQNSASYLAE